MPTKFRPKKILAEENKFDLPIKNRVFEEFSKPIGEIEGLETRKLIMKEEQKDVKHKVQKLSLGEPISRPTKIILLVGATGTGKTTLINAMVNFIFRIEFKDDFRLVLIDDDNAPKRSQAESQTDMITAYAFYHLPGMPFDFNYILIDTPGFGDTRGIARDREMMSQLETFLKKDYGIDQVDGVGFVTPASATRLTQTQLYVYDGLSSMFGKDIKDNIYIMSTFADAKQPPVLDALREANVLYSGFYKFNNSALYANNCYDSDADDSDSDDDDDDDDHSSYISMLFWEMGYKSLSNFFLKLGKTLPASLTLTKEVLEERRHLHTVISGLQNDIQLGLSKLSNLTQEREMLNRLSDDMEGSKNYEEEVEVPKIIKHNLGERECVTNCSKCSITCHYPCYLPRSSDKMNCAAMLNGSCTICPENCSYDLHHHMEFRFETTYIKEKRTVQELLDRYNKAMKGSKTKQAAIKSIEDDINNHAKKLIAIIQKAKRHVERLEAIALKPNPISTKEYIDLLIEAEKIQKRHNFEKRIKMLEALKQEVAVMQGVCASGEANNYTGEGLLQFFKKLLVDE